MSKRTPPIGRKPSDSGSQPSSGSADQASTALTIEAPLALRLTADPDRVIESDVPTVLETIRGLHAKTISGRNLLTVDRRAVVEHLWADGLTIAQVAEILKVSERTVKRDRKAILQLNAIEADPELVPQMVGRLISEAELCMTRIRTAARDKEAEPAVRVDAEHRCFQILNDMVHRLQRLGYLPTAAQRLEAHLTHQTDDLPNASDLHLQLKQLRMVAKKDGAVSARLNELEATLVKIDVFEGLSQVSNQLASTEGADGGGGGDNGASR